MDLENFEFRPLTEGLGFDKTTDERKSQPKKAPASAPSPIKKDLFTMPEKDFSEKPAAPVSRSLKKMLDSLPPSVDFNQDTKTELGINPITAQVPQTMVPPAPVITPTLDNNFDITLNDSLSKAFPKAEVNKPFYHQTVTPIPQYKEVATSVASAFIDFFIIIGLSSLFVVSLVALTEVDVIRLLTSQQLSGRTLLDISLLFAGVSLIYYMIARGLFGSTLGDWAFDIQLGSENERFHMMYPFQVLFRTFIIMVTGLVLIPLLSVGFGKDMAYYFSGLKLYSRQY